MAFPDGQHPSAESPIANPESVIAEKILRILDRFPHKALEAFARMDAGETDGVTQAIKDAIKQTARDAIKQQSLEYDTTRDLT